MTNVGAELQMACALYKEAATEICKTITGDGNTYLRDLDMALTERLAFNLGKHHGVTKYWYKKIYHSGGWYVNGRVVVEKLEDKVEGAKALASVHESLCNIEEDMKLEFKRARKMLRKIRKQVKELEENAAGIAEATLDLQQREHSCKRKRDEEAGGDGEQSDSPTASLASDRDPYATEDDSDV